MQDLWALPPWKIHTMRFRFSSSWEHFNLSYRSLLVRHNGSQCPERGYMVELGVNEGEQTTILLCLAAFLPVLDFYRRRGFSFEERKGIAKYNDDIRTNLIKRYDEWLRNPQFLVIVMRLAVARLVSAGGSRLRGSRNPSTNYDSSVARLRRATY